MKKKTYKYQVIVTFESLAPLSKVDSDLAQYENGLTYFTQGDVNNSFIYGSGNVKLKKIPHRRPRKKSAA
jgi:hypothetical protein